MTEKAAQTVLAEPYAQVGIGEAVQLVSGYEAGS